MGKGTDNKGSRIFNQCYVKCCKLQNLTPLSNVFPSNNGKVLDFCVDRIKYVDWPPILNALSCDLSLHSLSMRCRQQVKTVLEQVDCERLAKTVNKRAVILTRFMLSNLVEALAQLLGSTTLLLTLLLEGLPLRVPYLNPLCEAILANSSLQHLYLPCCLIGDAGCAAVCHAVRCLPNILTLDLSGCDLTPVGAGYIAELLKYQKIHRYSENWVHTLRYRLPELDAMAGLRRISLCGNAQLGDAGAKKLLDTLADDLWIKALDLQNCGLTVSSAGAALAILASNTALVVLDVRHNPAVPPEHLSRLRRALRENERAVDAEQYSWLNSVCDGRSIKSASIKNVIIKDRSSSDTRNGITNKYINKTANVVKKEKDYVERLEEQLADEAAHRAQLEELNLQLVEQMQMMKRQHMQMWAHNPRSSGSEQSLRESAVSGGMSSSSDSTSSVPIDHRTLSYIQQAFRDIYAFIKDNQCHGQCMPEEKKSRHPLMEDITEITETESAASMDLRINIVPKKAHSAHLRMTNAPKMEKITKSAHMLGDSNAKYAKDSAHMIPEMFERQIGDTTSAHIAEHVILEEETQRNSKGHTEGGHSSCSSVGSVSSDTLVCSPEETQRSLAATVTINPREALYSSTDDEDSS